MTRAPKKSAKSKRGAAKSGALDYPALRDLALSLGYPDITEAVSWGQPCLKVNGKLWFFWSPTENAPVFKVSFDERDFLVDAEPDVYFYTDHYRNHALVLARPDRVDADWIRANLARVWRSLAKKKDVKAWDAAHGV
ncbi:MAG: MmcQ/YjbR family DNA-binding protein [Parvularculaceae bacterium]|nr:MmcQ/YjbR family DNA-binding protein [Parvularculaceae bacterium]